MQSAKHPQAAFSEHKNVGTSMVEEWRALLDNLQDSFAQLSDEDYGKAYADLSMIQNCFDELEDEYSLGSWDQLWFWQETHTLINSLLKHAALLAGEMPKFPSFLAVLEKVKIFNQDLAEGCRMAEGEKKQQPLPKFKTWNEVLTSLVTAYDFVNNNELNNEAKKAQKAAWDVTITYMTNLIKLESDGNYWKKAAVILSFLSRNMGRITNKKDFIGLGAFEDALTQATDFQPIQASLKNKKAAADRRNTRVHFFGKVKDLELSAHINSAYLYKLFPKEIKDIQTKQSTLTNEMKKSRHAAKVAMLNRLNREVSRFGQLANNHLQKLFNKDFASNLSIIRSNLKCAHIYLAGMRKILDCSNLQVAELLYDTTLRAPGFAGQFLKKKPAQLYKSSPSL